MPSEPSATTPLLQVYDLEAFYGDFQALFGVSLTIAGGQVVAIIGANGAGKTTLLKSIAGLIATPAGAIRFDGQPIGGLAANRVVARGIALVPEGRRLFPSLTVEENLQIGGQLRRSGHWTLDRVYRLFPDLKERRSLPSTALSGGQQQMAAIGRALMSNPRLLLLDEVSLGLSPAVIQDVYAGIAAVIADGLSVVIVEQDIGQALKSAHYVYCLQEGRVALEGAAAGLTQHDISAAYFGV
jgi:branched-chain amino acid transport system ATP-binding protein